MKSLDFMKKLFGFVILIFLFSSCLEVRFENSQPVDTDILNVFPEEIIGKYFVTGQLSQENLSLIGKSKRKLDASYDSTSTEIILEINPESFIFPFLQGERFINKDFILKRLNDSFYTISLNFVDTVENIESWIVFPFSVLNDSLTIYTLQFIPKSERDSVIDSIEQLVPIERIYSKAKGKSKRKNNQVETVKYYIINPTKEEFSLLLERNIFMDWVSFKKEK